MEYTEIIEREVDRVYPLYIYGENKPLEEMVRREIERLAYKNGLTCTFSKQITEIEVVKGKIEALKWVNPILVDDIVKIDSKIEQLEHLRDKFINELKLK